MSENENGSRADRPQRRRERRRERTDDVDSDSKPARFDNALAGESELETGALVGNDGVIDSNSNGNETASSMRGTTTPEDGPTAEERSENDESAASVKDTQVGTYMYLPRDQKKEIERLYTLLKAEYEYEYEQGFEKNRHFFPLLVKYGLDQLDGSDVSEIQAKLSEID